MEIVSYAMGEGAGYDDGYKAGEESTAAYQEGYDAGETAGYTSGYSAGYSAGYDEGVASVTPSAKKLLDARNGASLFATNIYYGSTKINTGVGVLADGILKSAINYDDFENCTNISNLFMGQYLTTEFPTFNTSNVKLANYTFADCFEEEKYVGEGCTAPYLDLHNVTSVVRMFEYAHASGNNRYSHLKTIPLYDFSQVKYATDLFNGCSSLESIPALNFNSMDSNTTTFMWGWIDGCYALKEINILDIHYNIKILASTQFTREALVHIIGNLRDMTGSTALTLTMGSTNMAKLTEDDIAVATDKNWTLA